MPHSSNMHYVTKIPFYLNRHGRKKKSDSSPIILPRDSNEEGLQDFSVFFSPGMEPDELIEQWPPVEDVTAPYLDGGEDEDDAIVALWGDLSRDVVD